MHVPGKAFFFAKKKQKAFIPAVAALLLPAFAASAATVTVDVQGVRNSHGQVLVALCTKAEFLHPHCAWRGKAPAALGATTITIPNVPPGTYAAQAFHDENNNGHLDRSILGLPREAMGFSNNAPMHLGPPRFDTAAFAVSGDLTHIGFVLHYY